MISDIELKMELYNPTNEFENHESMHGCAIKLITLISDNSYTSNKYFDILKKKCMENDYNPLSNC